MKHYIRYSPVSGEIVESGYCSDETFPSLQTQDNSNPLIEGVANSLTHYVSGGVILQYTNEERTRKASPPSPFHTWSNLTKIWVDNRSLEDMKRSKELQINDIRLSKNKSFFTYAGKQIACDELSRSDIDGVNGIVALTQQLPPNWVGGWKAMDNTYVSIPDVNTWIQFFAAMINQGTLNFNRSQALKAYVNSLTDPAAIDAVTWDTVLP